MSKEMKQQPGLDFVTPIVELLHEFGVMAVKGLINLVKYLYKKLNKDLYEIQNILLLLGQQVLGKRI